MKIFVFCLIFLLAGCAEYQTQTANETRQSPAIVISQNELENLEEAFYLLDKPLAHYYCLVNRYSKRLQEYLEKGKNGDLSSTLVGLSICFQKTKEDFQRRWREIYANPDGNVSLEAEKLLHQVKRHTIDIEEKLEILERMASEEKIWI